MISRMLIPILALLLCLHAVHAAPAFTVTSGPAAHAVLPCGADGYAAVQIAGTAPDDAAITLTLEHSEDSTLVAETQTAAADGGWEVTLGDAPAGGPYRLIAVPEGNEDAAHVVEPLWAGDLWILAGQSNMQGVGNMDDDVTPPHPMVQVFAMNDRWRPAEEPLHRLGESVDPVHNLNNFEWAREGNEIDVTGQTKGSGLGLAFAHKLAEANGRPIGLVPCAHGGTSMVQWDPVFIDEEGDSLYGAMIRRAEAAGGKIRGVLWYQGESDAAPERAVEYMDKLLGFVEALRRDLDNPDLPFYYVQIGAHAVELPSYGWDMVQTAQLEAESAMTNAAMVASIDLPLDDPIHIGRDGLQTLGERLAEAVLRGDAEAGRPAGPRVERAVREVTPYGARVRVELAHADGGLTADGAVSGFSLYNEADEPLPVFRQELASDDSNAVLLWALNLPEEGAQLWYGRGLHPLCTVRDAAHRGLPVTGPVAVE